MSVEIRGASDKTLEAIASALHAYQNDHPDSRITLYRYSPYSVRVRVVDPSFAEMTRGRRNNLVWDYLERIDEEDSADVNMLLLRTPGELETSIGNMEFEHPSPPLSLNESTTD